MKAFDSIQGPQSKRHKLLAGIALVTALFAAGTLKALTASASAAKVPTETNVDNHALDWFASMQSGKIDRTQLTPEYNSRLTNDAVRDMSRYLKEHDYGVPPRRAEVVQTRTSGSQTLYVVKLVFPRGDAASLLFGFNSQGKITGISLLSMAGD